MRKELKEIENIERYLLNVMDANEKNEFEKNIQSNPNLKAKVDAQKLVMDAVNRIALKQTAQSAHQSYKLKALLSKLIILISAIAVAGFITIKLINSDKFTEKQVENTEKVNFLPKNDSISNFSNKMLDEEIFRINTKQDTVIENQDGVVIYIPANAFDTDNDNIDLLVQSALKAEDILYAGLSTTSNGNELETGGMFYIDAFTNGKRIKLVKDLEVNVPTQNKVDGMQLYQGEKTTDGEINWVNPVSLKNKLTPVDILTLDFFPPTYNNTLTDWGYPKKKFKDSLYYSFAERANPRIRYIWSSIIEGEDSAFNSSWGGSSNKIMNSNDNSMYYSIADKMNEYNNVKYLPKNVNEVIQWHFSEEYLGDSIFEISITANQKDGWHIYSQERIDGCIFMPTKFEFTPSPDYKLIGKTKEYGTTYHVGDWPEKIFDGTKAVFKQKIKFYTENEIILNYAFMVCSKSACFPPEERMITIQYMPSSYINPASIKTIWNTKFNNTNLATKQFEERLVWIHKSCNQQVLNLYINNLDKSLAEVDSMVIPLVSGEVKTKFIEFAKRNDGRVEIDDVASQKLSDYFKLKQKVEAKALVETQQNYWNQQQEKDNEQMAENIQSALRETNNKAEVFQKEYKKNLCKVYDELDYPQDCNRPPIAPNYYNVTVNQTGWNNIDKQVYVATQKRETTSFSYKGKTSSVTYNKWTGTVNDYQKFERINVYNIPLEFKSYVKLSGKNGTYNYKLNADLKYQTVILAWTENNLFFAKKDTKKGKSTFNLIKTTEKEFKTTLKSGLSNIHNMDAELNFAVKSQKDVKRVKENIKRKALRLKIEPIIFPCNCK